MEQECPYSFCVLRISRHITLLKHQGRKRIAFGGSAPRTQNGSACKMRISSSPFGLQQLRLAWPFQSKSLQVFVCLLFTGIAPGLFLLL